MICVGVDAGGSSTVAALSQGAADVRGGRGHGANATTLGVDDAADIIISVVRDVLDGEDADAIYIGAAGAGRARVSAGLREMIEIAFRGARVVVGGDGGVGV